MTMYIFKRVLNFERYYIFILEDCKYNVYIYVLVYAKYQNCNALISSRIILI